MIRGSIEILISKSWSKICLKGSKVTRTPLDKGLKNSRNWKARWTSFLRKEGLWSIWI